MLDIMFSTKKKYKIEFFEWIIQAEDVRGLSQQCVERGDFTSQFNVAPISIVKQIEAFWGYMMHELEEVIVR